MKTFKLYLPVYFSNLLVSLSYAMVLYLNSSYLSQYFTEVETSLLFALGALGNVVLFFLIPVLTPRYGSGKLVLIFLVLEIVSLAGIIAVSSKLALAASFLLYTSVSLIIYYILDIFLESISSENHTGEIRGTYLTLTNLAIALAPFIFTFIVTDDSRMPLVYFASLLLFLPVIVVSFVSFRHFQDGRLQVSHTLPFRAWLTASNIRRATIVRGILEFFFAVMVIYTPIYLHMHLGFSWQVIGVIFFVMLIPFIFLSWPVGELADRWCGEKEFMSAGLFIMGVSLLIMPFLGPSPYLWASVLFLSRVGASLVETTTDTHFFKHVDKRDIGLIGIYRLSRPAGVIVGSFVGIVSLALFSFEKLFFVIALVMLLGLRETIYLKDTK